MNIKRKYVVKYLKMLNRDSSYKIGKQKNI